MSEQISIVINGTKQNLITDPNTPLLWVLRDNLGYTGTKYGCGKGLCGSCTVHVNGEPTRSCLITVNTVSGKEITTIEGISSDNSHPVQQAWLAEDVPQCGYCQAGQIMSAIALLKQTPNPDEQQISDYMSGNLCRCGTYGRIKKAIKRAASNIAIVGG